MLVHILYERRYVIYPSVLCLFIDISLLQFSLLSDTVTSLTLPYSRPFSWETFNPALLGHL